MQSYLHVQSDGVTALILASANGDAESLELLIKAKADVGARNSVGSPSVLYDFMVFIGLLCMELIC